jgi:cytochrome c peroxidase
MRLLEFCTASALGCGVAGASVNDTPAPPTTNPQYSILMPLPAPVQTPNVVPLSDGEQLGKDIFFDHSLSNPEGYACATCHVPQTGFTGPSSALNLVAGPTPGVVPGRADKRKPQSVPYATFSPEGPQLVAGTYLGGEFWDGHARDAADQAGMPFVDPIEMANTPEGPFPPHAGGYSPLVVSKLKGRPYTPLFRKVFGGEVFNTSSDRQIYAMVTTALAKYEASAEVNQFSSKFDASTNGTPPMNLYQFTPSEENGRKLYFGKAQCFQCHSSASLGQVSQATQGRETFTMYCYANIGVPKNPANPCYEETNCVTNPQGCNPLGPDYIDYGLGADPNPAPDGTRFMNATPGDIPQFWGLFKTPSARNVDLRPYPGFVKSYMHNGVFKSLEEVVHFYNKRNIATNAAGDEVTFVLNLGPPPGYQAIFPPPEVTNNLQNLYGLTPDQAAGIGLLSASSNSAASNQILALFNGQVGNLQLTAQEETDLVNFLKTLTDGYIQPQPAAVGK